MIIAKLGGSRLHAGALVTFLLLGEACNSPCRTANPCSTAAIDRTGKCVRTPSDAPECSKRWIQVPPPAPPPPPYPGEGETRVAYDEARQTLFFDPRYVPGLRLAYDAARERVVAFSSELDEWDGTKWERRTPAISPPSRTYHSMAYDSDRQRIVIFGGTADSIIRNDTWEWDGTNWFEMTPAHSPQVRALTGMTYDAARHRMVLFSGLPVYNGADTWTWDGSDWEKLTPAVSPPARIGSVLAYDAAREQVVLFGGGGLGMSPLEDTWVWDGTNWTEMKPVHTPGPRAGHSLVYDPVRQVVVLAGGGDAPYVWEWDGNDWTSRPDPVPPAPPPSPPPGEGIVVEDTDRQRLVVFTNGQTWEWDGAVWENRTPKSGPSARASSALAYDEASKRVVLFGGENVRRGQPTVAGAWVVDRFNDTWEWDGTNWTERAPASAPSPRAGHALAYDRHRKRLVLFGGRYGTGLSFPSEDSYSDTWEWDGKNWAEVTPPGGGSPPKRNRHALAYDEVKQRIVLFGGASYACCVTPLPTTGDTWEWDGTHWNQQFPASGPRPGRGHSMAWDELRKRVVLVAGTVTSTWDWDGTAWDKIWLAEGSPQSGSGNGLAFDPAEQRLLFWSGTDLWMYLP